MEPELLNHRHPSGSYLEMSRFSCDVQLTVATASSSTCLSLVQASSQRRREKVKIIGNNFLATKRRKSMSMKPTGLGLSNRVVKHCCSYKAGLLKCSE